MAPLSAEQESYAADDAWVSLEIYDNIISAPRPGALSHFLVPIPEASTPQFGGDEARDDEDDAVPRAPSDTENVASRVAQAISITDHGLELESDWLWSPPVEDASFVERLNREKHAPRRISRIKLDPFHWMDRYARVLLKSHVLFPLFMACLRDALFFLDPSDVVEQQ